MSKVKQLQMDIQYIQNVLSANGEEKAVQAFENVRRHLSMSEPDVSIGDRLRTIGELRQLMQDLDDHDLVVIETIDENGDSEDLYPLYMDVIENVRLTDGSNVREVRFCQMDNVEPEVRDCMKSGYHLQDCDADGFCNNCGHQ